LQPFDEVGSGVLVRWSSLAARDILQVYEVLQGCAGRAGFRHTNFEHPPHLSNLHLARLGTDAQPRLQIPMLLRPP
jgi:hypothetical protein